jgi:hypothetical protein
MDQNYPDPAAERYEVDLRFTFRITDYSALSSACLDAVLSQLDDASDEYVAFVRSDPLHGLMELAEQALRRGMPGIDLEFEDGGLIGGPEEPIDGWPPDNPPWPDAENLPEDDD